MYKLFFCLILSVLWVLAVQGADSEPKKEIRRQLHFSINTGIPSSETYFVHQDKQGYIWICTDRGVARYDGFRFEIFNTSNGLPDNVIFRIFEDYKGRIWFVSFSGKLSYYDHGKIVVYKYNKLLHESLGSLPRPSKRMYVDALDNLYYSNFAERVIKITKYGKVVILVDNTSDRTIYEFHGIAHVSIAGRKPTMREADVYFGGKYKRVKSDNSFAVWLSAEKVRNSYVVRIQDELIWFDETLTNRGIFKQINDICVSRNNLFVCTNIGVKVFRTDSVPDFRKQPTEELLSGHKVSYAISDSEGGTWITTLDDGVYYLPSMVVRNYSVHRRKAENSIQNIFTYNGTLCYSNCNGYYTYDNNQLLYRRNIIASNPGAQLGKYLVLKPDMVGSSIRFKQNLILCADFSIVCKGKNNSIIIGGEAFCRIDSNLQITELYCITRSKKTYRFEGVVEDDEGRIYAGGIDGLFRIVSKTHTQEGIPTELKTIRVSALAYDKYLRAVWVGTRGHGLYLIRGKRILKHISEDNGLINNQLNYITVASDHSVWISSNSGISRVMYVSQDLVRIRNLTRLMGLASSEVGVSCELNDTIYFATRNGISAVPMQFPNWNQSDSEGKNLVIKSVSIDKKRVLTNTLEINQSGYSNSLDIRLRNRSYIQSKHILYRYRLRSSDNWNGDISGRISFVNLEPGTYSLEITYQDPSGRWVKPYELIKIRKSPKYYQATWFYVLLVVLLLAGVTLFFIRRNNQLRAQYAQRTLIEQLEQKSLIAQINPHFIFNSLNSIQSFLIYDENENAEKYLLKLARLIRSTLTVSRENNVTIEMEKSLITQYLELEQMRFKKRFEYRIEMRLTEREQEYFIPPMLIQPFVENSVLHGFVDLKRVGLITVSFLKIEENRLYMEITDNGVGRKPESDQKNSAHRSYGTQITRERLDAFRKKYQNNFHFEIIDLMQDGKPAGTKIELVVPILNKVN